VRRTLPPTIPPIMAGILIEILRELDAVLERSAIAITDVVTEPGKEELARRFIVSDSGYVSESFVMCLWQFDRP